MIYLLLAAAFAALVWLGRQNPSAKGRGRGSSSMIAGLAAVGAVLCAARGAWQAALVLGAVAVWIAARNPLRRRETAPPAAIPEQGMSENEARAVLGVGRDAGAAEIQAAYVRLMRTVHPDRGGTSGLAAQLNAARDRLLDR